MILRHWTLLLGVLVIRSANAAPALAALPESWESARDFNYCELQLEDVAVDDKLKALDTDISEPGSSSSGQAVASAVVVAAGLRIARDDGDACAKTLTEGMKRFDSTSRRIARVMRKQNRFSRKRDARIAGIQQSIAEHWLEDQSVRQVYVALRTEERSGPAFWAFRLATGRVALADARSVALMRELLDEWDWIDRERFGTRISQFAWLLVQHADHHPELQQLALDRMKPYLGSDGIRKADYAYLWDRVAVNAGRKQRYGTQPVWACTEDGRLKLEPLEAPETVDQRRAELGMKPYQLDLDQMTAGFCR